MKIEGMLKPPGPAPSGDTRPRSKSNAPEVSASDAKVELSSLSSSLNKADEVIATTPAVDHDRVAEIRQAISEGRFKVNANRIADGLIESVRQMLEAQSTHQ